MLYNKTHSINLPETELKTIVDDIFSSIYEEYLQENALANTTGEEFDLSFHNRNIEGDTYA
jgi:hypothetical protein